jgi:hypothetical protein
MSHVLSVLQTRHPINTVVADRTATEITDFSTVMPECLDSVLLY